MNGDDLFMDLMGASTRLESAYDTLRAAGELETAQIVYRAKEQLREAIAKLAVRAEAL
jgi:hypothetical protein